MEHTGDIALEIWGNSRENLLENAAWALTDTMVEAMRIDPIIRVCWEIVAENPESLLVRHLEELLFQMDAKGMVFGRFSVQLIGPHSLECIAEGEPLNREKHGFKTEIKAVTYHRLQIWRESDGVWHARVILDV